MKILPSLTALVCVFFLAGCQPADQKIENAMQQGHYVKALEIAQHSLQKGRKKAVMRYLETQGPELLRRLRFQGSVLMKRPEQDKAIRYYKTLIPVIDQLIVLDAPLPKLTDVRQEFDHQLRVALSQYLAVHYELGEDALRQDEFRRSAQHFDAVLAYQPNYRNASILLKQAQTAAASRVAIQPFFKHRDGLRANSFVRRANKFVPIIILNLHVEDEFMQALLKAMDDNKSTFLSVALEDEERSIQDANWHVEGHIDALEEQIPGFVDSEKILDILEFTYQQDGNTYTEERTFTYMLYRKSYQVTVELFIRVYPDGQPHRAKDFPVSYTAKQEFLYRDNSTDLPQQSTSITLPVSYTRLMDFEPEINKNQVAREAIQLAAEQAAKKILGIVDSDH